MLTIASNFRISEKHFRARHIEHRVWYIGFEERSCQYGQGH